MLLVVPCRQFAVQADARLVQQLVPLVLKGTEGKGCSPDFKAASFMILVQLASRAVLADKLLERAPKALRLLRSTHPPPAAGRLGHFCPALMRLNPSHIIIIDPHPFTSSPGPRPLHASS